MSKYIKNKFTLVLILALLLANLAYFTGDFLGWIITLGFFLLVPGYLLLNCLIHELKNRWEILSFSLGLSLLLLMVGGLALNSLHAFGLSRPLSTTNIFITLDILTVLLLVFNRNKTFKLPNLKFHPSKEKIAVILAITLLPLLAIGGAIRLNNGASNILTMVLFALIPILIMLLVWRKTLKSLYPYAILMIGLSVLLSTSLRGQFIVGSDIHHEFAVFQAVSKSGYWSMKSFKGDPYNACLSITILPTIIAKITSISALYIYKFVFQLIFAFGLIPIYLFIKRLSSARIALIGALIFISFPPFLNDMPFLNRQEIAFVFFGLLMLTGFLKIARIPQTILTFLCLIGLILSHYSSSYVALVLLLLSWIIFKLLIHKPKNKHSINIPLLSLPVIFVALLFTFLWNTQITTSTAGLEQTVSKTVQGLWGHPSSQASGVSYSFLSLPAESSPQVLANYSGKNASLVNYQPPEELPVTSLGKDVSHIVNVDTLNNFLRSFSAKLLQILLLIGIAYFIFKKRKKATTKEVYFYSLVISCVILLALIVLLPQLSVDYGVTRLFQQTLIITALPIIIAAEFLLAFLGKFRIYVVALIFALLFLDLSGFVPQAIGGYPPQLALNNSGVYYDVYYIHDGELIAGEWLGSTDNNKPVAVDFYSQARVKPALKAPIVEPALANSNTPYVYQSYSNSHTGSYADFISGDVIEYTYPNLIQNRNILYSNQDSRVYGEKDAI